MWVVRGGFPQKLMNVYLIEDDDGVTVFDAGIESMARGIASVAAGLGGIKRVVLGHGHPDHRGAAPRLGAPVFCHPDNVADTEGDGGEHYFRFSELDWYARPVMPRLLPIWDGGPVKVEGTVSEGDEVAGFRVIDLPGHAPGLIGLWRESDRLALVSDTFYTLDPQTGPQGRPARAAPRVQPRHRAGAREHPQARGDGAGGGVARPRGPADRRRARAARAGGERDLGDSTRRRPGAGSSARGGSRTHMSLRTAGFKPALYSQFQHPGAGPL